MILFFLAQASSLAHTAVDKCEVRETWRIIFEFIPGKDLSLVRTAHMPPDKRRIIISMSEKNIYMTKWNR